MSLSRSEVRRIAALARIALTEEEEYLYEKELSSVLAFVAELEKLDVRNVVPMAGGTDRETIMREDEIIDADLEGRSVDLLAAVPERMDDLVKVRQVF